MLLGVVSAVVLIASGAAAWLLTRRPALARAIPVEPAAEFIFAGPAETTASATPAPTSTEAIDLEDAAVDALLAGETPPPQIARATPKAAVSGTAPQAGTPAAGRPGTAATPAASTTARAGATTARAGATTAARAGTTAATTSAPAAVEAPVPPIPEITPLASAEIFAKLHQLSFGLSAVGEAWPPQHDDIISATTGVLQAVATEDRYTPRRPSLLPQLLRAMNDEEVSRRELVSIISKDPSLVGNLLKMANSPFYRVSSQAVESIDRAVVILGNDGIRSLIAAALAQPIFQIRSGDFPKFPEVAWEHTFRTASATVTHTAIVEKSDPFAAQLLGLVAGMAGIVVFRVVLDQYEASRTLRPHPGVVATLLDMQSVAVAKRIATSWGLSDRILAALDDQTTAVAADRQTALGRSLSFGRISSALAVLYVYHGLDDLTAQASMPVAGMPATELKRLWSRLAAEPETAARKKPRSAAR